MKINWNAFGMTLFHGLPVIFFGVLFSLLLMWLADAPYWRVFTFYMMGGYMMSLYDNYKKD